MTGQSSEQELVAELAALAAPSLPIDEARYTRSNFLAKGYLRSATTPGEIMQVVLKGLGKYNASRLEQQAEALLGLVELTDAETQALVPADALIRRGFAAFEGAVADRYGSVIYGPPIAAGKHYALGSVAIAVQLQLSKPLQESA